MKKIVILTIIVIAITICLISGFTELYSISENEHNDNSMLIKNELPTASCSAAITNGQVPLQVEFYGLGYDSDGSIVRYQWDFGDGSTSNEQNPLHTYYSQGTYNTTFSVTDDRGASDNDTIEIIVEEAGSSLDLTNNLSFTEVVHELDTPEKLSEYMRENFRYKYTEGHISYPPEEFFYIKEGNCKDLATFGSYVLKQHGYNVKIMCLKMSGDLIGQHAITLIDENGGNLTYITNNAINNQLFTAESLDEILAQESKRLGCEITRYGFVDAGSTYVWVDYL